MHFQNIDFDIEIEIFGNFDIDIGIDIEKNGVNIENLSSEREARAKWIKPARFFIPIGDLDWQNQRDKIAEGKSS